MSESTVPAVAAKPERSREERAALIAATGARSMTPEQVSVIKATVARGATDDELRLFIAVCTKTGLDPFTHQIHLVKRWSSELRQEVMAIQTGIDGYRLIAQRSGEYEGQVGPWWCGPDGKWLDLWTSPEPPFAAKVGIMRRGFREVLYAIARWDAYVQTKKDGGPNRMWTEMGPEQLAKCAEALGLRKAFPQELSDLYSDAEMERANGESAILAAPLTGHPGARDDKAAARAEEFREPSAAVALEEAAEAIAPKPAEAVPEPAADPEYDPKASFMEFCRNTGWATRSKKQMLGLVNELLLAAGRAVVDGGDEMDAAAWALCDAAVRAKYPSGPLGPKGAAADAAAAPVGAAAPAAAVAEPETPPPAAESFADEARAVTAAMYDGTPEGLMLACRAARQKFPDRAYVKRAGGKDWFCDANAMREVGLENPEVGKNVATLTPEIRARLAQIIVAEADRAPVRGAR